MPAHLWLDFFVLYFQGDVITLMRVKYHLCVSFTDPTMGLITIKLPFGESKDVIADAILGEISVPNLVSQESLV